MLLTGMFYSGGKEPPEGIVNTGGPRLVQFLGLGKNHTMRNLYQLSSTQTEFHQYKFTNFKFHQYEFYTYSRIKFLAYFSNTLISRYETLSNIAKTCVVFDIPCLPPSHHSFTPMRHKFFIVFLTFSCLETPENGDVIYGRPLGLWRLFARYVRWFINNQTPPDKFNAKQSPFFQAEQKENVFILVTTL